MAQSALYVVLISGLAHLSCRSLEVGKQVQLAASCFDSGARVPQLRLVRIMEIEEYVVFTYLQASYYLSPTQQSLVHLCHQGHMPQVGYHILFPSLSLSLSVDGRSVVM
jgi:hypothetical protein